MVQLDVWGNISLYDKDGWYKQVFFEDKLLKYEDSLGNYWTTEFGDFPFLKLKYINKSIFNAILIANQNGDFLEVSYKGNYDWIENANTFHNIDAEAELTAMLSEQLAMEF